MVKMVKCLDLTPSASLLLIFILLYSLTAIVFADDTFCQLDEPVDSIKYVPENDSTDVEPIDIEMIEDTDVTISEPDTLDLGIKQTLQKKSFIGTNKDVMIAAGVILAWLFFMWLAANQGPD